jgi:hypothetical protein
VRFFSRGPLPEEKRKVPSRTGTEPEAESPEKTHEAGENNNRSAGRRRNENSGHKYS